MQHELARYPDAACGGSAERREGAEPLVHARKLTGSFTQQPAMDLSGSLDIAADCIFGSCCRPRTKEKLVTTHFMSTRILATGRMKALAMTAFSCALVSSHALPLHGLKCHANTVMFFDSFDAENGDTAQFSFRSFAHWDVTRGDVDLIGNNGLGEFYPGHGLYVDLDGSPGQGRMESKSIFNLLPGEYLLSFAIGNNPFLGSIVQHNRARIRLADVYSEDFTRVGVSPIDSLTRLISVGASTTGRLVLESLDPADFAGVIVDDVRLERVPEPGASLLAATALSVFARRLERDARRLGRVGAARRGFSTGERRS